MSDNFPCSQFANQYFQPFTSPALLPMYTWHSAYQEPVLSVNKPSPKAHTSSEQINRRRRRWASKFSKRRMTLLDKANSLNKDCGVDVYLCVRNRRNNQFWSYSSHGFAPPTAAEMGTIFPIPIQLNPNDFDTRTSVAEKKDEVNLASVESVVE